MSGLRHLILHAQGRAAASDVFGDFITYRNLNGCDPRLPSRLALQAQVGIPRERPLPRKHDPDYARLVAALLSAARAIELPAARLRRLVYIGDTRMSDVEAFEALCQAGGWQGAAFIGAETQGAYQLERSASAAGMPLTLANHWGLLFDFAHGLGAEGIEIDEQTVIVLDLDKTTLGARGRNAGQIDAARLLAVRKTVAGMLGEQYNQNAFQTAYNTLNQQEFHPFTADNQDYLAYICLMLGAGVASLEETLVLAKSGASVLDFMKKAEERRPVLSNALALIHDEIYDLTRQGDPTPFKTFRRNEFYTTSERMGWLSDETPVAELLAGEIVLTGEVLAVAKTWQHKGALIFGLSDKPDEASLPPANEKSRPALHRCQTHVVGTLPGG
jgi:hypothetical protein